MNMVPETLKRPGQLTVLVTGGRDYSDEYTIWDYLDRISDEAEMRQLTMVIVQGGATGADALARTWAFHNNVHLITEHADWKQYGRAAGPIRNRRMLDGHPVDLCLAMPGGLGTNHMMRECVRAGVPVIGPP